MDPLRQQSRRWVTTRTVVVRRRLVDNDGSNRIPYCEALPTGGASAGVACCDRRLLTESRKVIVATMCPVPIHPGHRFSLARV